MEDSEHVGWVFDPIPPSGAIRGGIPVSYVFDGDLNTFVREVLQNSHDQKVEDRAEVEFEFTELDGDDLVAFLEALGWPELRDHLVGVAERNVLTSRSTAAAVAAIDGLRPLRVLKVSDYGTYGLTGSEDEAGTNYKALVKDILETTDGGSKKGGSHGLGKAVLWAFSSISTVLFSSSIADHGDGSFRFVGRADLPFHTTPDNPKGWDGSGWLGEGDPLDAPVRAISVWDDAAVRRTGALQLGRNGRGNGTSILIPAFYEPQIEEQRPLEKVAEGVVAAAIDNFWPAIHSGTLKVSARVHQPDGTTLDLHASNLERVMPFVEAVDAGDVGAIAINPGDVAERLLEVRFPASVNDPSGRRTMNATARLVLRRSGDPPDHENADRVALVRGAGMVVEYWKPRKQPLSGDGFYAVLEAGYAHGQDDSDEYLEAFLRASEPPAHNRWDPRTNRIHNEYHTGSIASVSRLWDDISNAIFDMCETPPPPDQDGPDLLKKMFPIGQGKEIVSQSFRVTFGGGEFDGTYWAMSARVQRLKGQGSWQTRVSALLDGESGKGLPLKITSGELSIGSAATAEVVDGVYVVAVPSADDVTFTVRADGGDVAHDLLRRSRARLHTLSRVVGDVTQ